MSLRDAASLSDSLLVVKGAAAPSRPAPASRTRSAAPTRRGPDGSVRISLRLDEERCRRVRLAGAHLCKSRQALLRDALDYYLDQVLPALLAAPCQCLEESDRPDAPCGTLVPLRPA